MSPYNILCSAERPCRCSGESHLRLPPLLSALPRDSASTSKLQLSRRLSRYSGIKVSAIPRRVRSDRYGAYYYDRVRPHLYPRANAARAARLVRRCIPYSLTAAAETPQHIGLALRAYDGDVQREYDRKLALHNLAEPAECYTLLYCFRKERG